MASQTSRASTTPRAPYSRRAGDRPRRRPASMRSAGSSTAAGADDPDDADDADDADDDMVCVLISRPPFQGLADLALEVDELEGVGELEVAWSWEVHVEDRPGAPRGARHDTDPVSQQDGLLDVVGDEHDRHPVAFPQVQE